MRDLHADFAWVVVVANGVAGTWALIAHWIVAVRHRALWWFTAVAQVALVVQVALGVGALGSVDEAQVEEFHYFYGFVSLAAVGILYSYRAQIEAHRHLLYGFGGLFLTGLALRSIQFAP